MTREISLNNPAGIVQNPHIDWQGETIPSIDAKFCQFQTMAYGCRALIKLLGTYIYIDGRNTIAKIIPAFAPANDNNNVEAYEAALESFTGINRSEILTGTVAQRCNLAQAIVRQENSTKEAINAGLTLKYFEQVADQFGIKDTPPTT